MDMGYGELGLTRGPPDSAFLSDWTRHATGLQSGNLFDDRSSFVELSSTLFYSINPSRGTWRLRDNGTRLGIRTLVAAAMLPFEAQIAEQLLAEAQRLMASGPALPRPPVAHAPAPAAAPLAGLAAAQAALVSVHKEHTRVAVAWQEGFACVWLCVRSTQLCIVCTVCHVPCIESGACALLLQP